MGVQLVSLGQQWITRVREAGGCRFCAVLLLLVVFVLIQQQFSCDTAGCGGPGVCCLSQQGLMLLEY
jgi:hypothetical protein